MAKRGYQWGQFEETLHFLVQNRLYYPTSRFSSLLLLSSLLFSLITFPLSFASLSCLLSCYSPFLSSPLFSPFSSHLLSCRLSFLPSHVFSPPNQTLSSILLSSWNDNVYSLIFAWAVMRQQGEGKQPCVVNKTTDLCDGSGYAVWL